jgi:outer membrane murein-binding lipoprotein Lpp
MCRNSLIVFAFVFGLSGCAGSSVGDLQQRVDALSTKVDALQSTVDELKRQGETGHLARQSESVAHLTPANDGYSVLRTELGVVTISLEETQSAGDGTKATLRFGNVSNATLDQVKATIEWGKQDEKPAGPGVRSKTVNFMNSLQRGQWTNVDVVLEGIAPSELGFVTVKDFQHSGISLLGRPLPTARSR